MIRMKSPELTFVERITEEEYNRARRFGIPASHASYGFLAHNVIGVHPTQNRSLHDAYIHYDNRLFFHCVEPMTDYDFQHLRLDQLFKASTTDGNNVVEAKRKRAS